MSRLTEKMDDKYYLDTKYIIANQDSFTGPAIDKLANLENIVEDILAEYQKIGEELKLLRANGDKKSVKFRELLGRKLIYSNFILILEKHELIDKNN